MEKKNLKSKYPPFTFDWMGGLILFAGLIGVLIILSVISTAILFSSGINLEYNIWYKTAMNVLPMIGSIALFDFAVVRPKYKMPLNFNFSSTNFYTYLLIFPMMFGMMLICEFFTNLIPITGPFLGNLYEIFSKLFQDFMNEPYLLFFMLVISAPLLEEIIFRGIIQKGLINGGMRPRNAIFFAALLFGLVHANPWQFVAAVLLGSVLGQVYYKTKTLLLPILLHSFNNAISYAMLMSGKTESFEDLFGISNYILLILGVVIFGIFYYLFTKKYKVHYSEL